MDKRFNRYAMFFSTLFLVMLVFAAAAFFYGIHIGTKNTEDKYAKLDKTQAENSNYTIQQQDLISFHLTVYSPFREFQLSWNNALNKVANKEISNVSSLFKELEGQASKKAKDAASFNLQHAGILGQAQENYIRSLNLFEKTAINMQRKENASSSDIQNALSNNDNYTAAISQAVTGQDEFFSAMQQWGASLDPNIQSEFNSNVSQKIGEWNKQPLLIKNKIATKFLLDKKLLTEYLPHDLVSSVDQFIVSGQAESMNLTTLEEVISLIVNTGAVRSGDYNLNRNKLYSDEFLPQIPFFYPNVD